jgi:VWFA-related protein
MTSVLQMMRLKQRSLGLSDSTPCLPALVLCLAASLWAKTDSGAGLPMQHGEPLALQGQEPTQPILLASDAASGLINLDVVVTDKSGKTIPGLGPNDFTLLDNGQPQKILSFSGFDGNASKPDPPVAIILVIDTIEMPGYLAGLEREGVEKFLRRNGGHLAQRVTIYGLSDNGFWTLAQPSRDGNALAAEIAGDRLLFIRRWNPLESIVVREPAGLKALKALGHIGTVERQYPGKKLLLWVGPGSGIGTARDFKTRDHKPRTFDTIYWFSNLLREARISLFSITVGQTDPETGSERYMLFLNGVESAEYASLKNLDRKVLAVQSGGRVLDPGNDLVSQIDSCVRESSAFYTLSFDPSRADHPAEYHSLHVQVREPGLTARTNTGYYDQPYYSDQANLAVKRITVEQLERTLVGARGESDAKLARRLSDVELSERLSKAKLVSWTASLRSKRARQALVALADASAFLGPPPAEIPADAPPEAGAQRSMISLAVDYLNKTIPKLPNFYATRTTVRYEEPPPK